MLGSVEFQDGVVQCGSMQINPEIFNFCNFKATDGGAGQTGYFELRVAPLVYINKSEVVQLLSDLQGVELTRFEKDLLIQEIGGGDKLLPNGDMATNGIPINLSQVDGKLKFDWVPGKEVFVNPQDFINIMTESAYPADYISAPMVPTPIPLPENFQPQTEYPMPRIGGLTDFVAVPETSQTLDPELQKRVVEQRLDALKASLPLIGLAGSIGLTLTLLGYLLRNWAKLKGDWVAATYLAKDGRPHTQKGSAFSTPTKNRELSKILASPLPEEMTKVAELSGQTPGSRMRKIMNAADGAPKKLV